MKTCSMRRRVAGCALTPTVLIAAGALPVSAAAQERAAGPGSVIEEIVVTGSNIRRNRDFETPSPIQTLDSDAIEAAGIGQMQDLLISLSANAGSELNSSQTDRQGTSQFSLRGLGVGGTLTLINGRRAGLAPVTTVQGFFFTDVNQYPPNMIESVEVLLDGASATYGSEAVAGVVNIITRTNFEGFEIGADFRANENNPARSISAAFGGGFDRGHFSTFVNYYSQERGHRGDYDWLVERADGRSTDPDLNLFDSSTGAGRYNRAVDPDGDGFYQRIGNTVADPHCGMPNPLGGPINTFFDGTNCRYNFIDQRTLIAEENRIQVFSQLDYDLTDNIKLFAEASLSRNEVKDTIGGAVMDVVLDGDGHFVPASHPFNYFIDNNGTLEWNPDAVAADPSLAVDVIFRGRPLTTFDGDLGDDITRQFDDTRIVLGLDATLSDAWSLNASYVNSRSKLTDVQPRSYYAGAFRQAIASGRWNPFGSGWATPNVVSVKDNVTVAGNSIKGSSSDLALFAANRTFIKETTQQVFEIIASGDLFKLSGNTVAAAIGAQYREVEFSDIADSLSQFRIDGRGDPVFSIDGASQDAYAFFAEAIVPLSDDLELQAAIRYEDYGEEEGGDTIDPKLAFRWDATETVALRGSVGTSFQAPTVRNIEGAVGSGILADPILSSVFAAGPGASCNPAQTDSFNAAQVTIGGGLDPQSAVNWNLGAIFRSAKFIGSVDYWTYDFEDLIGPGEAFGAIVAGECADTDGDGIGDTYVPDPRVGRNAVGQLSEVFTSFINLGRVETDGIDVSAAYSFDNILNGRLVLDAKATYINSFDIDFGDGSPVFNGAGNRNSFIDLLGSVPDFRLNVGVNWLSGRHSAALFVRYISGYDDREPSVEHDSIDAQTLLDVQYSYTLEGSLGPGTTMLAIGANNVTDEDPPAIDRDSVNGRIGFDGQVHDPRGRIVYLRLKHTF